MSKKMMPNAELNLIDDVTLVGLTESEAVQVRLEIEGRYGDAHTLFHARIRAEAEKLAVAEARLTEALRFSAEGWPQGVEWDGGEHARAVLSTFKMQAEPEAEVLGEHSYTTGITQ